MSSVGKKSGNNDPFVYLLELENEWFGKCDKYYDRLNGMMQKEYICSLVKEIRKDIIQLISCKGDHQISDKMLKAAIKATDQYKCIEAEFEYQEKIYKQNKKKENEDLIWKKKLIEQLNSPQSSKQAPTSKTAPSPLTQKKAAEIFDQFLVG